MTPLLAQRPRADRAFERLYRRHVGDVYRYALAVLRSPDDAEDVTQTTFMNAYRAFQAGERPRAPRNWLIAIAHNVCRQRFRQSARRPSEVALDEELTEALPENEGPSAEELRRALGHLAFNQRAALVMRELEGRSYAEIAEILDISVSAVETLLFRARRALREQLEESLTCVDAELAISRQLDGRLPRAEKGRLRAHLRECAECATFARSQRAQRSALKSLGAVPLPASLSSFFGGGGAAVGTGLAAKAILIGATAAVAAGVGVEGAHHHMWPTLGRGQSVAADRAESPVKAKPAPTASRVAVAAVAHTAALVTPAKPAHAVPVRRSDLRPVKHVEHENNVRGARPEHPARPSHPHVSPPAAAEPVAVAAARGAHARTQHVPASHRHASQAAATRSHAAAAHAKQQSKQAPKPKQTPKPKHEPTPPQSQQPQQGSSQPGSGNGNGSGSGQGSDHGNGAKQH